jgi:hypothetical protein
MHVQPTYRDGKGQVSFTFNTSNFLFAQCIFFNEFYSSLCFLCVSDSICLPYSFIWVPVYHAFIGNCTGWTTVDLE